MAPASLPPRLSPSALDRYRSCPRRYLWQDVERRRIEQSTSPELVLGNAVHHALELLFSLHASERTVDTAHHLLRSVWTDFRQRDVFTSRDHEAACGHEGLDMLSRYVTRFDMTVEPLKLEQSLQLRLPNGTVIRTRVDRIDPGDTGGRRIVDYKTGKQHLHEASGLAQDTAEMVHLLAVQKHSGLSVERLSHIYLLTGEEVAWEPEPDDVDAVADRFKSLLKEIATDDEFLPAPGQLCAWCPFALHCDSKPQVNLASFVPVENVPF